MNRQQSITAARGLTDAQDRLLTADEPLAELHEACGGTLPGTLAIPELLALVRRSRGMGLRIAKEFSAFDGEEIVSGFARIQPIDDDELGGCEVIVENWHRAVQSETSSHDDAQRIDEVDRATAEVRARLDARQQVQIVTDCAGDATSFKDAVEANPGSAWSDHVELQGISHQQPLHWRLLDGASASIPGSSRNWRVRLIPLGPNRAAPRGFELLLLANEPLGVDGAGTEPAEIEGAHSRIIGSALTPVLRQPIARIIANAETIRTRLAGPLRDEYSEYAGNIAAAGQHLSGMLDDLADLEVVEAPGFSTASERVDLADVARRATGILGVRARDRKIDFAIECGDEPVIAMGEFRRVLQILINLIGNAIAYSPEGSTVTVTAQKAGEGLVSASVRDEGPGVDAEQAEKIFDKFERLGRDSDGGNDTGSGLGLYISRKLALAMGGDLEVVQPSQDEVSAGAQFKLTLAAADTSKS
ncbi:two-component signal transduction histidine kinase [Erythrobacter sp. NAP1]|uniref:sensor histidine kinase n=1 Tax=Erythrobacter sp. NAP1 TaxID=237727 RepID=UPI0000686BCB|nr:HAMP domain-containing sensor histidine kinase [Erythrobacter sp. NAP1]EAQ30267.1 two-component signal transduction histidine kinase [Erythrobacter sp. NAP1]